jgi:hypothetical protein
LRIVCIETHDPNEARDLFVRLQAGLPLTSQEKRDSWPGQFTDFVLRLAGKPGLTRYPGVDFFRIFWFARVCDRIDPGRILESNTDKLLSREVRRQECAA